MTTVTLRVVPIAQVPVPRPRSPEIVVAYALMLVRMLLPASAIAGFYIGSWMLSVASIVAFVVLDVLDGVVARAGNSETALRRLLDGVLDKIAIHSVALAVAITMPSILWVWLPMLARDLVQAAVGAYTLGAREVVCAGAKWHRVFTIAVAIWGTAVLVTNDPQWVLGVAMNLVGLWALADYTKQTRIYLNLTQVDISNPAKYRGPDVGH